MPEERVTRKFVYVFEANSQEQHDQTVQDVAYMFGQTDERTKNPNELTSVQISTFAIWRTNFGQDVSLGGGIIVPELTPAEQVLNAVVDMIPQDTFGIITAPLGFVSSEFLSDRIRTLLNRSIVGVAGFVARRPSEESAEQIHKLITETLKVEEDTYVARCLFPDGSISSVDINGLATSMLAWKAVGGLPVMMQDPMTAFCALVQSMGYVIAHRPLGTSATKEE